MTSATTRYTARRDPPVEISFSDAKRPVAVGLLILVSFCAIAFTVMRYDALVALAIVVCVAASAAMLIRPEIATLLTVFLLYINFPAILTKQHGLPHVVAGAFILILAFPLLYTLIIQRRALRGDATFYLMLLLLVVSLISAFGAVDKGVALKSIQEYVLEGVLLYWLIFNVIRTLSTLRRVIWILLFAGALLSSLSLYQTVTRSYNNEFGGLAYRSYELIQDAPVREGPAKRRTWDRAGGPLDEPNRFAQILIVLIPLGMFICRTASGPTARIGGMVCTLLIAGGVLLTLSRGAFLGLIVLVLIMTVIRWIRLPHLILSVMLLAGTAPWVPFFAERMSGIARLTGLAKSDVALESREIDSASLIRMTVMLSAVRVFRDHVVLGVGPGQFPPFYSQKYSRDPEFKSRELPPGDWRAHSLYLEIAAELGALGLIVFLSIVGLLLRSLWMARRRWKDKRPDLSEMATAFALSIIAYQITGVFLHLNYQPYYWFLLATSGAALHIMLSSRDPSELERRAKCSP